MTIPTFYFNPYDGEATLKPEHYTNSGQASYGQINYGQNNYTVINHSCCSNLAPDTISERAGSGVAAGSRRRSAPPPRPTYIPQQYERDIRAPAGNKIIAMIQGFFTLIFGGLLGETVQDSNVASV
ncbi:hypothetical protein HWV62_18488 [Athelia sp. TMB]|nr:hypothetical protein HWV62_18488 [Athelia sp. TMB]